MAKGYSRITRLFGRVFQLSYWLDFERLKNATLYVLQGAKKALRIDTRRKKEQFATVAKKFSMTEPKLKTQESALLWWGRLLFVLGACILGFGIYHFSHTSFRASLISIVMAGVAFAFAFRYTFFAFQIQQRKLGCTFQEWARYGLMRRKK